MMRRLPPPTALLVMNVVDSHTNSPSMTGTRQKRSKYCIATCLTIGEPLPVGQRLHPCLRHRNMVIDSDVDRVNELAGKRGVPPSQIALAWLLQKPVVTSPIVGATKPHHLEDAVAALALKLAAEEMQWLEEPYRPHPYPPGEAFV